MITPFPEFTPVDISHKPHIEAVTQRFRPYSDFNFISLFVWNIDGSTQISELNGNLVVRLLDYTSNEPIYSIIGANGVDSTIGKLLEHFPELKLVPEEVVANLAENTAFTIYEDRDNFDYIYDLEAMSSPSRNRRKKIKRLSADLGGLPGVSHPQQLDDELKREVMEVFDAWVREKPERAMDAPSERNALLRLLNHFDELDLILTIFRVNGKLCAFSIDEPLFDGNAICHFAKALNIHEHIYSFTDQQVASNLYKMGFKYVNWEQDLGMPGLRAAKLNHQPVRFHKKFTIAQRSRPELSEAPDTA